MNDTNSSIQRGEIKKRTRAIVAFNQVMLRLLGDSKLIAQVEDTADGGVEVQVGTWENTNPRNFIVQFLVAETNKLWYLTALQLIRGVRYYPDGSGEPPSTDEVLIPYSHTADTCSKVVQLLRQKQLYREGRTIVLNEGRCRVIVRQPMDALFAATRNLLQTAEFEVIEENRETRKFTISSGQEGFPNLISALWRIAELVFKDMLASALEEGEEEPVEEAEELLRS